MARPAPPAVDVRLSLGKADVQVDVPMLFTAEEIENAKHPWRTKRLARAADEPLAKALERLAKAAAPKPEKRVRKAKDGAQEHRQDASPATTAVLLDAKGVRIDAQTPNAQAWSLASQLQWQPQGTTLPVRLNAPSLEAVWTPDVAVEACPLLALPQNTCFVAHADDATALRWRWHRCESGDGAAWTPIPDANVREYTPTQDDVGHLLRAECTPLWEGRVIEAGRTLSPPATCRATPEGRDTAIAQRAAAFRSARDADAATEPSQFRIVSYNALADAYAHTWDDMYPYCDPAHRDANYRVHLLLDDIGHLDGDVVCMQEVDGAWFERAFEPHMRRRGYSAAHATKANGSAEGCAIFVRTSRFRVVAMERMEVRALAQQARQADGSFAAYVNAYPDVYDALQRATTIGQMTLLEETRVDAATASPRQLLVVNTHLFFHPRAGHCRVLQLHLLLNAAAAWYEQLAPSMGRRRTSWSDVGLVLCGDLNAEPFDAACHLLRDGVVSPAHPEWLGAELFRYGRLGARDVVERFCGAQGAGEATLRERIELVRIVSQAANTLRREDEKQSAPVPLCDKDGGDDAQTRVLSLLESAPSESHKTHASVAALVLRRVLGVPDGDDVLARIRGEEEWREIDAAMQKLQNETREKRMQRAVALRNAVAARGDQLAQLAPAGASTVARWPEAAHTSSELAQISNREGCGLEVRQTAHLVCATGYPEYTNFVGGFVGALDYVFVGARRLRSLRVLAPPPHAAVTARTALPSACFPSDHLPIACDAAWVPGGGT